MNVGISTVLEGVTYLESFRTTSGSGSSLLIRGTSGSSSSNRWDEIDCAKPTTICSQPALPEIEGDISLGDRAVHRIEFKPLSEILSGDENQNAMPSPSTRVEFWKMAMDAEAATTAVLVSSRLYQSIQFILIKLLGAREASRANSPGPLCRVTRIM